MCEEPNAISVATVDASGKPSVRVVLLKGYDDRGFIFYTNFNRYLFCIEKLGAPIISNMGCYGLLIWAVMGCYGLLIWAVMGC